MKTLRLLLCLAVLAASSLVAVNPNTAFAKQKEEQLAEKESVVYATKQGKKYHAQDCPFIKNRETISLNLKEAQAMGLKPCGRCYKEDEQN
jgi:hypothetical protein